VKFTRLRLSGFKSFVEPTELFVEPGLTAIVGPNGCGKSNLFDALRWVMGETRPTSVRGGEMDDVIFAGCAGRPSRNMAEVALFIDNADRSAPAAYNDYESIEVSRRIEREAGSVYRINGRDVRQRDVQIFFADASSGAGSTAFVRQGQIGLLISQKPLARRAILEEAAGIGGLHQRRHEAELRLKAAETNMGRLDDVIREVDASLQSLRRQARQASRYRNLSGLIRKAEALALHLRWRTAETQLVESQTAFHAGTAMVAERATVASQGSTRQADAAAALPSLRQTESERSAALHRLVLAREALEAEENRAREEAQRLRQRMAQTEQDLARERALGADAEAALAALAEEVRALEEAAARGESELTGARAQAAELAQALGEKEHALERLAAELANWNAQKNGHERTRDIASALAQSTTQQLSDVRQQLNVALATASTAADVISADKVAQAAAECAEAARQTLHAVRAEVELREGAEAAAREPLEKAERHVQQLSAEAAALAGILRPAQDLWPPVIDAVTVQSGYEAAFAAALGDDADAPTDEAAPHHWRDLGETEAATLPDGVQALSLFVQAPAALSRRLALTGVVFPDRGAALQAQLRAGQRLVSARGDLWRWDGYIASAEARSTAAARLEQRNRLSALETEIVEAKGQRANVFEAYAAVKTELVTAREHVREREAEYQSASTALAEAQASATRAARAAAEQASQLASLEAEVRRLMQTRDAAVEAERHARETLAELGDGVARHESVAAARAETAEARSIHAKARAELDALAHQAQVRTERLAATAQESARWVARQHSASEQIAEHLRRQETLHTEMLVAEAKPAEIAAKRTALLDSIAEAESARNVAADARAHAEANLAAADKAVKLAEAALAEAREARARAEALAEAAAARLEELRSRIRDELDAAPEALRDLADLRDHHDLPTLEYADQRVEKLKREREQLGGVNLRAEEEAQAQEERLATLTADHADLEGAIERLRRGIQSLNREGRERLLQSFEQVNANFQSLFAKLFQGGEANLTFTESEDPLEAGLEIFARPPGKRLQSLSLLSGGEQALTALALIFAVFLVNPAPICVLDEVEAPLDDANVERFCNQLDEMTRLTETRFVVITHHALTMSRMHRLFGVTMAERGVSQLVSVNLEQAQQAVVAAE
jgi:chromosome segregation protein